MGDNIRKAKKAEYSLWEFRSVLLTSNFVHLCGFCNGVLVGRDLKLHIGTDDQILVMQESL